jgi:uncharacterized protein involved in exopolysaccharide biosynthesis
MAVTGLAISLISDQVYRATAVTRIVEYSRDTDLMSDLAGRFGGLAVAAGIRVAGSDQAETVAVLTSKALVQTFVESHDVAPLLWPRLWDEQSQTWREGVQPPTTQRVVRRFTREVLEVREDRSTGLVRVSVRWKDPEVAAKWANELVQLVNDRIRERAVTESERTFRFLESELAKTSNVTAQQVIGRVMEEQLSRVALAKVRSEFALQVIDPAVAPDASDRLWPRPLLLTVLGAFLGLLAGALYCIFSARKAPLQQNPAGSG